MKHLKSLSEEDNLALLKRAKDGDLYAKELFFAHNMRLIQFFINKHKPSRVSNQEDIISACQLGLLKAYDRFDFTKDVKFSTYAGLCCQGEIYRHYRDNKKRIIADSIHSPVSTNSDGSELTLEDMLVSPQIESSYESGDLNDILQEFNASASVRDRQIVKMLYEDELTQREVGKKLGVSQVLISRTIRTIIKKLQIISKKSIKRTDYEMANRGNKINLAKLKWMFENTDLKDGKIAELLHITGSTVWQYRKIFKAGELNMESDPTAKDLVTAIPVKASANPVTITYMNKAGKAIPLSELPKVELEKQTVKINIPVALESESEKIIREVKEEVEDLLQARKAVTQEALETHVEREEEAKNNPIANILFTANVVKVPKTISLALEDVDIYNIETALQYLMSQLTTNISYKISIQIEQA